MIALKQDRGLPLVLFAWLAAAGAGAAGTSLETIAIACATLVGVLVVGGLIVRFGSGVAIALLALGGVDALPGPNLEAARLVLSATAQDAAVIALILVLFVFNVNRRFTALRHSKLAAAAAAWSVLFLALFCITVVRTVATTPVSVVHAIFSSRDFAYMALLLPLAIEPFTRPRVRVVIGATVGIAACVIGLAQIIASLGLSSLAFLVHVTISANGGGGLVRLYTSAAVIPVAALPLSIGAILFLESKQARLAASVVALISVVAIALALTRAQYVGQVVSLGLAIITYFAVGDRHARVGARRLAKAAAVVGACVLLIILANPPQLGSGQLNGIATRVSSTVTLLTNPSSQVGSSLQARSQETQELEYVLGGRWLFGVGFLDPTDDYNPFLPDGSVRNSDVGYLNTVMTIGVFGSVIYYLPLLVVTLGLLRAQLARGSGQPPRWLTFGLFAWTLDILITSYTLVTMFSPTGVVLVALMLGLGIAALGGWFTSGSCGRDEVLVEIEAAQTAPLQPTGTSG